MQLHERLRSRIKGFCFRKNIQDFDDVAQTALKGIMPNLETFEGRNGASFCTWADSIIENVCCDALREIIKHKNDVSLTTESGDTLECAELSCKSPEKSVLERIYLEEVMKDLPELERALLKMQLDSRSSKEMAKETGLSQQAARKRLSRLRKKSAGCLRHSLDVTRSTRAHGGAAPTSKTADTKRKFS
jgi:RNA polymerase sigma factor (sigma-70 family)